MRMLAPHKQFALLDSQAVQQFDIVVVLSGLPNSQHLPRLRPVQAVEDNGSTYPEPCRRTCAHVGTRGRPAQLRLS
jgi:hypothetical protein